MCGLLENSSPHYREDIFIMAIVITNGTYYIYFSDTGAIKKTTDINKAHHFLVVGDAIGDMKRAKGKTKGYYVYDTFSQHILWKRMSLEEIEQMKQEKISASMVKRDKNGKIVRRSYSDDVKRLLYLNSSGRCELCGRKILLSEMSIDHRIPLSQGGLDEVENLQSTCIVCNKFKSNILPETFLGRVTEIFIYQMEKKYKGRFYWKIINSLLMKMV